jgi:hypothetical protein
MFRLTCHNQGADTYTAKIYSNCIPVNFSKRGVISLMMMAIKPKHVGAN